MSNQKHHHLLLIVASAQGHLNPTLQLAKCLTRASPSLHVTFATTANARDRINLPSTGSNLDHLSFATFSTGFDDGIKPSDDPKTVAKTAKRVVSTSLHDLIIALSNQGRPIDLLIYSLMLPWAADVARELHVPSALLFIQSATTFAIYNRCFNGNNRNDNKSPQISIELPGLPLFESTDLPSFLLPSSPHYFAAPTIEDHIRALEKDPNPTVLINSFDALEESVLINAVDHDRDHRVKMITIGPLIPSAFSDMIDPSDTSYGCDLFERSREYLTWLDNKVEKSVIYVSFGSMAVMKRKQIEEILHGLELTGRPYLWVVRPMTHNKIVGDEDEVVIDDLVKNGLGPFGSNPNEKGLIVPWCSQVEVLSHPTIGCFVTHCGWNSILEGLVTGVPMVGVPQISDQPTNAKLVEEVWRVGIRAKKNNGEGTIVDREGVKRCVETVMGDEEIGQEIRRNTKKWMELALEAIMEGGSSNNNLECFLEGLQNRQLQEEVIYQMEGPLKDKELLIEEKIIENGELFEKKSCMQEKRVAPYQLLEKNIDSLGDGNHRKAKDNELLCKENIA
ncbi:crocetin glucosyltransferase, chloroplastic-like [Chenopodium quinoa]|uniref:crocetin glucosyltransferase, chloroplastic-like n=1 Tax=Chenopodium quinoa TaxID=63459 RepID=UPI000B780520|nr:crocetin glucosyltransferase, chloroplastic-like [Chenopodium quinoa]XP_021749133.1 crocetin glucosyltransferase, chloroplastic-like [Chenopodium quinoa]